MSVVALSTRRYLFNSLLFSSSATYPLRQLLEGEVRDATHRVERSHLVMSCDSGSLFGRVKFWVPRLQARSLQTIPDQ